VSLTGAKVSQNKAKFAQFEVKIIQHRVTP